MTKLKGPALILVGLRRKRGWGELFAFVYFLLRPRLFIDLQRGRQRSASTGCNYWELMQIHRSILEDKPHGLVEFGAGISTVVVADALHQLHRAGHSAQFTSLEESSDYLHDLRAWFPDRLSRYVSLIVSDIEDASPDSSGRVARRYTSVIHFPVDWVFVDGPQLPGDEYFDGDVLHLDLRRGATVIIDGRPSTADVLSRRLNVDSCTRSPDPSFTMLRIA